MRKSDLSRLTTQDRQAVEGFQQFLHWAGPITTYDEQAPLRYLAKAWYSGLMTIEEGKRIEQDRQVWQEVRV